jgi:hypothetical protein
MRVRVLTVAALALLGGAAAGRADAATQIATNPAGDQVLLHQVLGQQSRALYAGVRRAGGSFTPLSQIAPPPGFFTADARVDDAGGSVASWLSHIPGQKATAAVAIGAPDGSFGSPVDLPGVDDFGTVRMAANARGDAIVAYTAGAQGILYVFREAGGAFGSPKPLPASGDLVGLAVDADGAALAVVRVNGRVQTTSRPAGGDFGPVAPVPGVPRGRYGFLAFAAARNGRALLAFGVGQRTVEAVERPPGGSFGAPAVVTHPSGGMREPIAAAVAESGAAAVAYENFNRHAWLRARDAGGAFTASRSIGFEGPRIDVNDRGDAAAVWGAQPQGVNAVYRRGGAKRFATALTLAPRRPFAPSAGVYDQPAIEPSLALDGRGRATAAWEQWDGSSVSTVLGDFDGSGASPPAVVDTLPSFVREAPESTCRPADRPILRSSATATVFAGAEQDRIGCLLARGKPISLAPDEEESVQPEQTMALTGPFVGYGLDFVGHGDAESDYVVADLRDEAYGVNRSARLDKSDLAMLAASVLKANGAAAWISCPDQSQDPARRPACMRVGGTVKHVYGWNRRRVKPRLLDSGRRVDPRSFELDGSRLTWRRAGKLHHATLR